MLRGIKTVAQPGEEGGGAPLYARYAHARTRARTLARTDGRTHAQQHSTWSGAARDRRRARTTTASTPDADVDAARVVRVHTSHKRVLPLLSTYSMVCSLSHRVLATSLRPNTRAVKSASPRQPAPVTAAAPAAAATPRTWRRSPARAREVIVIEGVTTCLRRWGGGWT